VADLVTWCFHSPRRLLLVAAGLIAVVIGAGAVVRLALPAGGDAASVERPAASVSVAGSVAAVEAAVAFTRAWASKPASVTPAQWRQGLQPLVTPELGRLLAETDPAALPGGAPAGRPAVRFASVQSALIEVPLSTRQSVLVTVVLAAGGRWLASDVQPDAGDAGAATPGPGSSG
jgi:hypothetical protein